MTDPQFVATPTGLWTASAVLADQAGQPGSHSGSASSAAEMSGRAAAVLNRAVDGYCAAWSGRLSSVSAALETSAGRCTSMDTVSGAALAAIRPGGRRWS